MVASLGVMPRDVLTCVLEHLRDPKDRANFACVCRKFNEIFRAGVSYKRWPEHHSYLKTLKSYMSNVKKIDILSKSGRCQAVGLVASCLCCVTGIAVGASSGGCCCCSVSSAKCTEMACASLGLFGCAGINLCGTVCVKCCTPGESSEIPKLWEKRDEEEALVEELGQKLYITPQRVSMNDSGRSYQNTNFDV